MMAGAAASVVEDARMRRSTGLEFWKKPGLWRENWRRACRPEAYRRRENSLIHLFTTLSGYFLAKLSNTNVHGR